MKFFLTISLFILSFSLLAKNEVISNKYTYSWAQTTESIEYLGETLIPKISNLLRRFDNCTPHITWDVVKTRFGNANLSAVISCDVSDDNELLSIKITDVSKLRSSITIELTNKNIECEISESECQQDTITVIIKR